MTALIRMRLAAFVRGGRALAPAVVMLAVVGILYGGGTSPAAPAYGFSAVAFFPVVALSTKLLLDTEPDVQRRLARVSVGPGRELGAGLLAATLSGLLICLVAIVVPLGIGGITIDRSLPAGIGAGLLAHLLMLPAALALGALSSRVITRTTQTGLITLLGGIILMLIFGLRGSIAPFLVPPMMAIGRALNSDALPTAATFGRLTAWALAWSLIALTLYIRLRRGRA